LDSSLPSHMIRNRYPLIGNQMFRFASGEGSDAAGVDREWFHSMLQAWDCKGMLLREQNLLEERERERELNLHRNGSELPWMPSIKTDLHLKIYVIRILPL